MYGEKIIQHTLIFRIITHCLTLFLPNWEYERYCSISDTGIVDNVDITIWRSQTFARSKRKRNTQISDIENYYRDVQLSANSLEFYNTSHKKYLGKICVIGKKETSIQPICT